MKIHLLNELPAPPGPGASNRARLRYEVLACLAECHRRWPNVFPVESTDIHPLAIGTRAQLIEALGTPPAIVGIALRYWTCTAPYVTAIIRGRVRIDLDGRPTRPPTTLERTQAEKRLAAKRRRARPRPVLTLNGSAKAVPSSREKRKQVAITVKKRRKPTQRIGFGR